MQRVDRIQERVEFTQEMKRDYTILIPQMAPIHFELIRRSFSAQGYHMELLRSDTPRIAEIGLKYVHNDTCYPALCVIGQFLLALQSGQYDVNKTALMITQTGGGCRASNYIHLLRKALERAGFGHVPVISLNFSGLEKNSGFKLTVVMIRQALAGIVYGDLLMLLKNQVKPYEQTAGEADALVECWTGRLSESFSRGQDYSAAAMNRLFDDIVADFQSIKVYREMKPKVGIVGEIYVKYSPLANNNLEQFLYEQGCEVMVPGLIGFMMYAVDNQIEDIKLYGGSSAKRAVISIALKYLTNMEDAMIGAVKRSGRFAAPSPYHHMKGLADGVIGYGCKMGEGWLLTAEMLELSQMGYPNIICAQPFGCLPNHIVGKGMIRKVRGIHEQANIVAIDYDPGSTKVNQENRIKLMLSVARENMTGRLEQAGGEAEDTLRVGGLAAGSWTTQ